MWYVCVYTCTSFSNVISETTGSTLHYKDAVGWWFHVCMYCGVGIKNIEQTS